MNESQCAAPKHTEAERWRLPAAAGGAEREGEGELQLVDRESGKCLTLLDGLRRHAVPVLGGCDGAGSRWAWGRGVSTAGEQVSAPLQSAAFPAACTKLESWYPDGYGGRGMCIEGNTVWLGSCSHVDAAASESSIEQKEGLRGPPQRSASFHHDPASGVIRSEECPGMCLVPSQDNKVISVTSAALALGPCSSQHVLRFDAA